MYLKLALILIYLLITQCLTFWVKILNETRMVEVFLLGFVQGISEWFPISSSGHLVIIQESLRINVSVTYDVILHLGTLLPVILLLRGDLMEIFRAVLKMDFSSREGRLFTYLVVGSMPVAIAGFLFKSFFESLFTSLIATGIALLLNGFILYLTRNTKGGRDINMEDSLLIGIAQAIAIVPGISRTGATVSTALLRGVEKKTALNFSLLLSIPEIIGGSIVKIGDVDMKQESLAIILLGMLVAAFVGYVALRILRRMVEESFFKFSYYCLIIGIASLVLGFLAF